MTAETPSGCPLHGSTKRLPAVLLHQAVVRCTDQLSACPANRFTSVTSTGPLGEVICLIVKCLVSGLKTRISHLVDDQAEKQRELINFGSNRHRWIKSIGRHVASATRYIHFVQPCSGVYHIPVWKRCVSFRTCLYTCVCVHCAIHCRRNSLVGARPAPPAAPRHADRAEKDEGARRGT